MKYLGIRYAIADTDVKIIPWVISDRAKEDLLKLADYLYSLPDDYEHFSMFMYLFDGDCHYFHDAPVVGNLSSVITSCGTVACAVGHAPLAGVDCERFEQYQDIANWLTNHNIFAYDWMFSGEWAAVDDTPKGAAARIYFAIEQGIPFNPRSFALGDNYLPYVVL
jgi:hypothetical protein